MMQGISEDIEKRLIRVQTNMQQGKKTEAAKILIEIDVLMEDSMRLYTYYKQKYGATANSLV
jgi:hypothetical protein